MVQHQRKEDSFYHEDESVPSMTPASHFDGESTHMFGFDMAVGEELSICAMAQSICSQNKSQLMVTRATIRSDISGIQKQIFIFFDSGAERSLITKGLAEELKAPILETRPIIWNLIDGKSSHGLSNLICGTLLDDGNVGIQMVLRTIQQCTGYIKTFPVLPIDGHFIRSNNLPCPKTLPSLVRPDILIGMDYYNKFVLPEKLHQVLPSGLSITQTRFGPIIYGLPEDATEVSNGSQDEVIVPIYSSMEEDFQRVFSLEQIGISDNPSKDAEVLLHREFEEHFLQTVQLRGNQIWVRLPMQKGKKITNDNLTIAMSRLFKSHRSSVMREHGESLDQIFKQQLEAGIIEEADSPFRYRSNPSCSPRSLNLSENPVQRSSTYVEYIRDEGGFTNYIPHSLVVKETSATTKKRIVFDASAHVHGSPSLNDCLNPGPVILPDLLALMNNVRMHKWTIISDVEKAFHTIYLQEADRDLTRFLWWKDYKGEASQSNMVVYRFTRLPFGLSSSPAILGRAIQYSFALNYPQLLKFVNRNLYVDNFIVGTDQSNEIPSLCTQSIQAFEDCAMNLREFTSNFPNFSDLVSQERIAKEPVQTKILGIQWNTEDDNFSFEVKMVLKEGKVSRRKILAATSSNYDPLGLCSPIFIKVKRFGQLLWDGNLEWDDYIGDSLVQEWKLLADEIHGIKVTIPRHSVYFQQGIQRKFHLVTFVDASNFAMCCVSYIRTEYWPMDLSNNSSDTSPTLSDDQCSSTDASPISSTSSKDSIHRFQVRIQTAKCRLAPKELQLIPRLELVSLFMGTNLSAFLINNLDIKFSSLTIFSDSLIVMGQVKKKEDKGTFVHNRARHINSELSKIAEQMPVQLRYVNTSQNPADIGTRGMSNKDVHDPKWWYGPTWLEDATDKWPSHPEDTSFDPTEEILTATVAELSSSTNVQANKRKRNKKQAIVVSQFVNYKDAKSYDDPVQHLRTNLLDDEWKKDFQLHCESVSDPFKLSKVGLALDLEIERFIIRQHQRDCGISNYAKSAVHTRDQYGIIRLNGRIPDQMKDENVSDTSPILIVKDHPLAMLLAHKAHIDSGHGGRNDTLVKFWEHFTCKGSPVLIRKACRACFECRRWAARPFAYPDPPNLPSCRVKSSRPFNYIGLDYAGPFMCKMDHDPSSNGSTCKVWVSLITCLTTRAIYLAIVSSLDTKEFVHMFAEFVHRKGCPALVLLDNQASFEAGGAILHDMFAVEGDDTASVSSTLSTCPTQIDQSSPNCPQFMETVLGKEVQGYLRKKQIRFQHITPLSPWKGAIYERMVGVFKQCLFKSAPQSKVLPFRTFQSLVSYAESCVNNRPLTVPAPGFNYVTPRMLCEPFANNPAFALDPFEDDLDYGGLKSQEEIKEWISERCRIQHKHWRTWKTTWINELRLRKPVSGAKRRSSSRECKVGDFCLVMDDMIKRRFWTLAKVTKLVFSSDGEVRSAWVEYKDKETGRLITIERSVCRLASMEIGDDEKPSDFIADASNAGNESTQDLFDSPTDPTHGQSSPLSLDDTQPNDDVREEVLQPVTRKRGRPRKNPIPPPVTDGIKRGRGRPRKTPIQ